eukprot:scaffold56988_cov32-Tisochrysis_lutea.AAC.4
MIAQHAPNDRCGEKEDRVERLGAIENVVWGKWRRRNDTRKGLEGLRGPLRGASSAARYPRTHSCSARPAYRLRRGEQVFGSSR